MRGWILGCRTSALISNSDHHIKGDEERDLAAQDVDDEKLNLLRCLLEGVVRPVESAWIN